MYYLEETAKHTCNNVLFSALNTQSNDKANTEHVDTFFNPNFVHSQDKSSFSYLSLLDEIIKRN